ncbi:ELWxxDGT repeat protein [Emticicia agri]|uniref:Ig-like domain-containing protein n=1 Tax=Emticicia agri TaxID=2492393 RepID=A0A4V1ZDM5_9BACT|nr:ELWxxDGT repeat protein [Emticicia agri]RYU96680.1 hypothetical protein EWM59_05895 [Emticicia agri]
MKQFFTRKHSLFLALFLCLAKLSSAQLPYIVKYLNVQGSATPDNLINVNGILYFTAYDADYTYGNELWRSDGTTAGTYMVKDINPGGGSAEIGNLTNVNGMLYFRTSGSNGTRLWKSDGTPEGTVEVSTNVRLGGSIADVNGTLFFKGTTTAYGTELWKTDGTASGTVLVKDVNPGIYDSFILYMTNVNGTLYFRASYNGFMELWKSDGTTGGTTLLKQFSGTADLSNLTDINGTLLFTVDDGLNGKELWKSDGTPAGTHLLKDIYSGATGSAITQIISVGSTAYFTATHPTYGRELWKSDGTEQGTIQVKDIVAGGSWTNPQSLINVSGTVFFTADDGTNGRELWKSDGTPTGTALVKDIYPGTGGSFIVNLINLNGTLYFWANNSSNGSELWKSDGTTAGTTLVKDIYEGYMGSSTLYAPANVNGKLYFLANSKVDEVEYNSELWTLGTCTSANTIVTDRSKAVVYNSQLQNSPATTTCHCDVFNNLIAMVESTGENPVSGNISNKVWIETANDSYVKRHYEIYPVSAPYNATGKVTLYFTQADFDEYNNAVGSSRLKLPDNSTDVAGISNVMIEQMEGSSETGLPDTYTEGTSTINPDDTDIFWNSTASRWEVSFATTGFGGFFLKTPTLIAPTDVSASETAICSGTEIWLSATCAEGNLNWYTSATGGSSIGTSSPLVLSPTSTHTYYAACEYGMNSTNRIATDEVVVTTVPSTPTEVSIDKASICTGTSIELTATCPIGTVKWYTQLSGGSAVGLGAKLQLSPLESAFYYAACENGDCQSDRVLAGSVEVTQQPTNPTGISLSATKVCSFEFISLRATCDIGSIVWYKGEFETTSVGMGDNWGEVPGMTTSYYVACENIDCKSERVFAGTVTVIEQPVKPADVSASLTAICSGMTITLSAYCSIGEVAWCRVGGEEDVFLEMGSIITQTPSTTSRYYAMCINGICESTRILTDEVVVTTMPSLPTGVSVNKTDICTGASITLTATCAIGTLTWYNDSAGDTSIGTGNNLMLTPTDTHTYYASCFNGDCETNLVATSIVTVTTQPINPTNVAVDKSIICAGEPVTLTASCSIGEPSWYSSATGGTALGTGSNFDHNPTSAITYYAACVNINCVSEIIATTEVTVRPTPVKPTNLSQWSTTVCSGISNSLSGSCTTGTLKWYEAATATTPAYEGETVYISINKTTTFYAACETAYCSSERVAMQEIVFYTRPVNPTGLSVNKTAICSGDSVTLTGSCSIGNIQWIRAYTAGGVEQYDLVPTYTPAETSIYYAYCMNGTCISDYLPTDTVTVTGQPGIPTGLYQGGTQICVGTGIYMTASCATGIQTWYNSSTGGTVLGTGDYFAPQPATTTTYYVSCENGNCKSARVAMNKIVVYPQPVKPTGVSVSKTAICNGETITLSGTCSIGTLRWYKTSMGSDTAFTYKPKMNTTYHALCSNDACSSESVATAEVVVTQQPGTPTNVSVNKTTTCSGETVSLTASCSLGTITWYNSSTGTTIVGTGNNLSQSPTANITYYAACVNGICNSSRVATHAVTVKPKPVVPVIAGRNAICAGENITLVIAASTNNPLSTFHWSGGYTGLSRTVAPTTTAHYKVLASYDGCNSDSSAVFTVTVNPIPEQPGIKADNATICKGNTVVLNAQCPNITDSFYWNNSTASNSNALTGYYKSTRTVTEPGTYKGWCESNTGCKGPEKSITITAGNNCGGKNFITITPEKPVICPDKSVTLTATGCSGIITWSGGSGSPTGTVITVKPVTSITYLAQCSTGGFASVDVTVATSAVVVSTNISTGTEQVKAVNSIESNKKIGDPDFSPAPIVTFEAGKSILLKPGFVADSRSVFKAEIKGCN